MSTTELGAQTIRVFLRGEGEHAYIQGLGSLRKARQQGAYSAVAVALLRRALAARFPDGLNRAGIVRWVASVRAGALRSPERLNPELAEDMVRVAFGYPSAVGGHSTEARAEAHLILLMATVEQLRLDDQGLDDLIAKARDDAEEWIARGLVLGVRPDTDWHL